MRRIIAILAILVAGAAAVVLLVRSQPQPPHYTVELDNAFGLVGGADVKVAGVRAGQVTKMRVDWRTHRALVDFEIKRNGFGSLRKDVFCETRPQSLIGEYFLDCEPGTSRQKLRDGATIPVTHTASTIPADLVNDIMQRPYRERLRIILDELGAGVAGLGGDLNAAIRRASPALRETDKVLAILGRQRQVIANLTRDADTVVGDLAGNRRDVGRFVVAAGRTASASAERRADIAAGVHRLPTFLRELRPTMAALGRAADAQDPALRNLDASARQLTRLLVDLRGFSDATLVNLRGLAATSRRGRPAIRAATPMVAQLRRSVRHAPELARNLAIVLAHLDNRRFAAEKDPRSPGGKGYTGLEALLQYPFDQTQAINIFDKNGHILKVDLFTSKCSNYQNPQSLKAQEKLDPSFYADCAARLGPNQPGVTTPDPTAGAAAAGGSSGGASSSAAPMAAVPTSDQGPSQSQRALLDYLLAP